MSVFQTSEKVRILFWFIKSPNENFVQVHQRGSTIESFIFNFVTTNKAEVFTCLLFSQQRRQFK